MRRLWFALGISMGALLVWSLLHKERKMAKREKERQEALMPLRNKMRMEMIIEGIEQGIDFTDEAWWEQELAQYADADLSYDSLEDDDVSGTAVR